MHQIKKIPQFTNEYLDFVKNEIGFSTTRNYFTNKLCYSDIYRKYHNQYGCWIDVGVIDSDVICDTLWNEMCYNKDVFGTKNPFKFMGTNNLPQFYKFYHKYDDGYSDEAKMIFKNVAACLERWWGSGQKITGGIYLNDDGYHLLCCLRDALQTIKEKNVYDFNNNLIRRQKMMDKLEQIKECPQRYKDKADEAKALKQVVRKNPTDFIEYILGDFSKNLDLKRVLFVRGNLFKRLLSCIMEKINEVKRKLTNITEKDIGPVLFPEMRTEQEKENYKRYCLLIEEKEKLQHLREMLEKVQSITK